MRKIVLALMMIVATVVYLEAQVPSQGQSQASQDAQASRDVFVKAYRIGPGDLLEIKVFELEQLNQVVRVSEDGSITLPLLGRVEVEGLTQDGVNQKITGLLHAKYV